MNNPVVVERELLEMLYGHARGLTAEQWVAAKNALAQPAEAEGVVPVVCYLRAFQDGTPHWTEDCVCEDAVYPNHDGDETYSMPMVRQSDHLAALSAVTAERDRLLSEAHGQMVEAFAERDEVIAERDRLLEANEILESQERYREQDRLAATEEADQLRAEVDALRGELAVMRRAASLRCTCGTPEQGAKCTKPCGNWLTPAMAAKEA